MEKKVIKEPIRIRQKRLANGNVSLYLDIYLNGKRHYEFLKLYLVPERTRADKEKNKQTMQLANSIKAMRIVEVQNKEYGFTSMDLIFSILFLSPDSSAIACNSSSIVGFPCSARSSSSCHKFTTSALWQDWSQRGLHQPCSDIFIAHHDRGGKPPVCGLAEFTCALQFNAFGYATCCISFGNRHVGRRYGDFLPAAECGHTGYGDSVFRP